MTRTSGFAVIALMCTGIFVCMLDTTIMNIAMPAIQDDLNISLETMSWVLNIYTMAIAVFSIPMARLAEILGKRKFFVIGLLVFAFGSALCGFAQNGTWLIASRFLQSVGASILLPCSSIIGVEAVPLERRTVAMALLGATQGLSAALGPALGGIITQFAGWNWVFFVNVPVCLAAVVGGVYLLNLRSETRVRARIDYLGTFLATIAITLGTLVLVKGNTWGWNAHSAVLCYVGSAVSVVLFVVAERKVRAPMVDFRLFRDKWFVGSALSVLTGMIFLVGITVLLPQFLTRFHGDSELSAAMMVTPVSLSIFLVTPFVGLLAQKIGNVVPIALGFLTMGCAYYLLHRLVLDSTTLQLVLVSALVGVGFGLVIAPAQTASASNFEGEMLTASQSVYGMVRQVGVVLAVAIFVGGLTHNVTVQKQHIVSYAATQVQSIHAPASVKQTILAATQQRVLSSDKRTAQEGATNPAQQAIPGLDAYTNNVSNYVKSSMASAFSDLYQRSLPYVLLCSLISLVFWRKRAPVDIARVASHTQGKISPGIEKIQPR